MRILYLDLDTLRADHLGCYGYHRDTSPNIDRIANEGTRFDNCYCSDAPCLPSRTALVTGRFGIRNGVVGHFGTAADRPILGTPRGFADPRDTETLPAFLRSRGLRTVTISPFAERHSAWHFHAGFSETHNTGKRGHESAEDVTPTVLRWIRNNAKEENWFLHVNYWDAHTPYRAPEEFGNPFKNEPLPAWLTMEVIEAHTRCVGPRSALDLTAFNSFSNQVYPRLVPQIADMADLRRHIDGYDCGIAYMDSHLGRLFEALESEGVLEDLAVIISSDHGENQGELGIYGSHGTADEATHHIPLIVRWPGCKGGRVDSGLHYGLDLPSTLAELLGRSCPASWDGESFAPSLKGEPGPGRDFLVLSQCCRACQRSVRFGDWLYVRTYHDSYHLFPPGMLFNLADDPYEQHDVANENPAVCQQAVHSLNEWHDDMMRKPCDSPHGDPLWTVMREGGPSHPAHFSPRLGSYLERLRETGRSWAVEEIRQRHPCEFPAPPTTRR